MTQKEIKQEVGPSNLEHLLTSSKPLKAVGSGRRGQEPGPGGFIIPGLSLSLSRTGLPDTARLLRIKAPHRRRPLHRDTATAPSEKTPLGFQLSPQEFARRVKNNPKAPEKFQRGGFALGAFIIPRAPHSVRLRS